MPVRRIRAVGGLSTDASALDQPEALRTASNVLLHRAGTIQPRPGFGDETGVAARSTDYRPIALVPFDGGVVVQSADGNALGYRLEKLDADTQYTGSAIPPDETFHGRSAFAEARGALYYTTSTGVRKLEAIGDSATKPAGMPTDYMPFVGIVLPGAGTSTRFAVDTQSVVAYRYVWVSESDGYVRRSAPSSRTVIDNASSDDTRITIFPRMYLPAGIAAGDRVEIYRTLNVAPETSDPGDEMFLATSYTVATADVVNGYIPARTVWDATPDAMLGEALYTNVSQQGILGSNERPPLAKALARWSRCLWLGNTTERASLALEVASVFDASYADSWRDGLHFSTKTVDFTSGSPTVVPTSVAGLKVGQYVSDSTTTQGPLTAGTRVPALTKIESITTIITISSHSDITTGGSADYLEFTGIPSTSTGVGAADTWRRIKWDASLTSIGLAAVGADANAAAANLATAIATTFSRDVTIAVLSGTAAGAEVRITDAEGHGVPITISETNPGAVTVSYELTMSANALASGSSVTMYAHDYVEIDGVEFYFGDEGGGSITGATGGVTPRVIGIDNAISGSETSLTLARKAVVGIMYAVSSYTIAGGTSFDVLAIADDTVASTPLWYLAEEKIGQTGFLLLRRTPGGAAVTFDAPVRPAAFRPLASSLTSESGERPARLWYSKPDEPEAFPPVNYIDVGDVRSAILALVPLDDVLLVWKEDGLFRVTGSPPGGWVVDEVQASGVPVRLLAPGVTTTLDDVCYAWTDRGVVRTAGDAVQVISTDVAAELRPYQQLFPRGNTSTKRGAYMFSHPRLGLVILAVPSAASDDSAAVWYVLHAASGRWSTWARTDRCAAYDPAEDRAIVAPNVSAWKALYERSDEDAAASYHDAELSSLSGTLTGGTSLVIAVADFAPWTPAAGDVVRVTLGDGVAWRRVTDVSSDGTDYTLTLEAAGTSAGSVEWRQRIPSAVEWQAQRLPGVGCRWQEEHVHLESDASAYVSTWPLVVGGTVGGQTSTVTVTATITPAGARSTVQRIGVPRDMVRAFDLFPRIEIACAGVLWRLAEINLHVTPQSQRIAR